MDQRPKTWQGTAIPYNASLDELKAAIDGSTPERWAAFQALQSMPGPDVLETLAGYASSSDPLVRRAAIESIGSHPDGFHAGPSVCNALRDPEQFVCRAACNAAATLRLSGAHDLVQSLLASSSPATRCAAIAALNTLWRKSDYTEILELFINDPSDDVRKIAAWALRAHSINENWRELFMIWRNNEPPRYRIWACELAAEFGPDEVAPHLETLANDKDGHVRAAAAKALRRMARED